MRGLYHHRWVVDHPKDYEFAKAVYVGLEQLGDEFGWEDITKFLEHQSEIFALEQQNKKRQVILNPWLKIDTFIGSLKKFLMSLRVYWVFTGTYYPQKVQKHNSISHKIKLIYCRIKMVGVTGIEPVTPTMST